MVTVASSRCSVWNPRSAVSTRSRLFASRPAPISSIRESATSRHTNARRTRSWRRSPTAPRCPCRSAGRISAAGPRQADTSPVSRPTPTAMPIVSASIRRSSWTWASLGIRPGSSDLNTRSIASASGDASAAAPRLSTRDSVRRSRIRSQRRAPSALRTAVSRARADACASCRFVAFTHAITSSRPTAPSSVHRARRRLSLAIHSLAGARATSVPLSVAG